MKRIAGLLFLFEVLLMAASCRKEYVKVTYENIYRVDSLFIRYRRGNAVHMDAVYSLSDEKDKESRQFYKNADSSLVYHGWRGRITNKNMQMSEWSAVDWRFYKIDFITNEDYDEKHPAGSLLNDILDIHYVYLFKYIRRSLGDGELMITDFYPYDRDRTEIYFQVKEQSLPYIGSFTILFYDYFGRIHKVESEGWEAEKNTP